MSSMSPIRKLTIVILGILIAAVALAPFFANMIMADMPTPNKILEEHGITDLEEYNTSDSTDENSEENIEDDSKANDNSPITYIPAIDKELNDFLNS